MGLLRHSVLAFALLPLAASFPLAAQTRDERWAQDINFFASQFRSLHPQAFARISPADFDQAVTDLISRTGQLTDYEILLGMNRVAALVGDAHSWIYTFQTGSGLRQLPIRLRWFKDGFYVVNAGPAAVRALGRRVTAINGVPTDEVLTKVRPFIPAENQAWTIHQAQPMLVSPEVLHAARIVSSSTAPVRFTFDDFSLDLTVDNTGLVSFPRKAQPNTPLHLRYPNLRYWFDYLPDSRTLYIQYNQCQQDPALPMSEFGRQVAAFVADRPVERTVFDLRYNTGGDSSILLQLLVPLQELTIAGKLQPRLNAAFIGRQTFSSGMDNAVFLKSSGQILLIGEPTGGSPNGPGEVRGFTLPNSRLGGQISTKTFALPGYAGKDTVDPDLLIEMTIDDWANERDPLLDYLIKN
ncbi:MAG: hypothetical protein K2Q23_05850 [Bryobacteraceae bacterium]|nr:hypothetical protein [Bryobacteraceae bacterium]